MVKFNRLLHMDLPLHQSAFLWGARKTGKSFYLKKHFPESVYYDLLKTDEYLRLSKAPWALREELLAHPEWLKKPIIIDEIQKVPALLDEVHWLIENQKAAFILCGSSARKLKRGAANLLGGRAWRFHFFPLVSKEVPTMDLLKLFNQGLLPQHYLMTEAQAKKALNGYIEDYLKEEIQAEGLVRSLPQFARFLDVLGLCNTEMINFSNIARDVGIDSKTVKNYFEIVVDTLLGYWVYPYQKRIKRDLITQTPKFYLFDVGVANRLAKVSFESLQGMSAGKSFEQFIFMELIAYQKLMEKDWNIAYWRTKQGNEVDFILGDAHCAIEVKLTENFDKKMLSGLLAFGSEHPQARLMFVARIPKKRLMTIGNQSIEVYPYQQFLAELWGQKIL